MGITRQFNADERAEGREARPITIGGLEFRPQRKTRKRSAEVQRLADESQRIIDRIKDESRQKLRDRGEPIPPDDQLELQLDADVTDEFNRLVYEQIRLLIGYTGRAQWHWKNDEGEVVPLGSKNEPPMEFLDDELDIEEAPRILGFLMGRNPDEMDDDAPDPTPPVSTPTVSPTPTSTESTPVNGSNGESPEPRPALQANADGSLTPVPPVE